MNKNKGNLKEYPFVIDVTDYPKIELTGKLEGWNAAQSCADELVNRGRSALPVWLKWGKDQDWLGIINAKQ